MTRSSFGVLTIFYVLLHNGSYGGIPLPQHLRRVVGCSEGVGWLQSPLNASVGFIQRQPIITQEHEPDKAQSQAPR